MAKALRILKIDKKEDEVSLRTPSVPVKEEEFNFKEFQEFLDDLLLTAQKSEEPAGGIASPQVGVNKRIFYILDYDTDEWKLFINPTVEPIGFVKSKEMESCLSVPNREEKVLRYRRVKIKYQDKKGQWHTEKYSDFNAITIQHENDHLDGVLFIDRI